jgi:Flp pilus assembly protein TadD
LKTITQEGTFESRELFRKAEDSIKRNNFEQAEALLQETLKIEPANPIYLSHLGLCIGILGDPAKGEEICRQAIRLNKDESILYVNLGRVLISQGNRQAAWENFERAYKLDNTSAPAALELSKLGVRRKPVLPFLSRDHALNIYFGKLRHKLLMSRKRGLKKL